MSKKTIAFAFAYFAITVIFLTVIFGRTIPNNCLLYILGVILLGGTSAFAGFVIGSNEGDEK